MNKEMQVKIMIANLKRYRICEGQPKSVAETVLEMGLNIINEEFN